MKAVDEASSSVHVTTFGRSFEGRALPLAVAGRVADASPATVHASGKLRVYIQANVHAGEVEGKEAMQAMLRDIVAPIYNADGNERVSMTSRGPQHGPIAGAGQRANVQGLHAYRLTFETPNNPAVDPAIVQLARGTTTRRANAGADVGVRDVRISRDGTCALGLLRAAGASRGDRASLREPSRTNLTGRYRPVERRLAAGTWRVSMRQPLARLAFLLLEPRSRDGLVAWNVLDEALKGASAYPILRSP